jgi:energy-coupling factor transporter ATP-binding protein EcfA2
MALESIATTSAKWIWEQYGKALATKAKEKVREKWHEFHWSEAEAKYRARMHEQHSTTRLLGHPRPIIIEDIFTDVYVMDKLTAFKRYDIDELQAQFFEYKSLGYDGTRKHALRLALKEKRLFILGKPGSGKTTFLKYLTLQALLDKIPKTPIFVSLKEWTDSGLELMPFLVQQFEICAFPDARAFIEHLLERGDALMLFDGLDEVNLQGNQRAQTISTLTNFAKRYDKTPICLTCRIAATDYSFEQFAYLEIADFDDRQKRLFAAKWYQDDRAKLDRFLSEFERPEHRGLRELAQTPLLLTLLCLAFDETLSFPTRRADLYKEALDALLKKWDASRGIRRDEIYRSLSPVRKEQMLARLAAHNFEAGQYFIRQDKLTRQIIHYLQQLPASDVGDAPDGEAVLKAIEAQHGILVERAQRIYSFSHLTFQEYFTACYVVDNAASGTITRLIRSHLTDDRWREVFLLAASLLDDAGAFFGTFLKAAADLIRKDTTCEALLRWSQEQAAASKWPGAPGVRATFIVIGLEGYSRPGYRASPLARELAKSLDYQSAVARARARAFARDPALIRARADELGVRLPSDHRKYTFNFSEVEIKHLEQYLEANLLLVECLELATVSDRAGVMASLLLPPNS